MTDKYAIIQTGGKQYLVKEGDIIDVELLDVEDKKTLDFEEVLFASDGKKNSIGKPSVDGAKVSAAVIGPVRGPKVVNYKYKRRKNCRRKVGHRQDYIRVKITAIAA